MGMKARDYCCCAIPIVNTGIYAVLTEQFVLGILAGALAVGTSDLVGAAVPSFAKWIFAIICWVAAGIQIMGFISVKQDRPTMYRRYVTLHIMATVAAFSVSMVWIIISAARHSTAESNCESDFFSNSTTSVATQGEGETLCNIFSWVDIGLMGGLWAVLAIAQVYFYVVVSSYGTALREGLSKYDSLYDASKPLTNDIPMNNRSDPWDPRQSIDSLADETGRGAHGHGRNDSIGSVSTVLGDKQQQPYGNEAQSSYGVYRSQSQATRRQPSLGGGVSHPAYAYTQDPSPTPKSNDNYYHTGAGGGSVDMPDRVQAHPGALHAAEGSFRRKTPRLVKRSNDFDQNFFIGR